MSDTVITVISSLCISGISAVAILLWKLSREQATTQATLLGLRERFADHARFIEMILDRVLPERGKVHDG